MSDKIFIDANMLIYLYSTEKEKQNIILSLLEREDMLCISTHVIMEFCNVLIKKLKYTREKVEVALDDFKENFEIHVYPEDMQHDQLIDNTLRIRNPFVAL